MKRFLLTRFLFMRFMKFLFLIVFLGLSVNFTACKSENENQPEGEQPGQQEGDNSDDEAVSDILWDCSHDFFMGLNEHPIKMVEKRIQEEDGERIEIPYVYYFNAQGNLTKYDPSGISVQESRWVPVDARVYTYQYDETGKLAEAQIQTIGVEEDTQTYTVEYGSHELYVPLPFSVGTLNFVLRKGVTAIKENGASLLTCDGTNTVSYSNEEGMGFFKLKVEGTYHYDGHKYPVSLEETKSMEEVIVSKKTVNYTFDENGFLLASETLTDMSGEYEAPEGSCYKKETITYNEGRYMEPKKVVVDYVNTIEGMESENHYSLQYWYNDKFLLTGITKTVSDSTLGENAEESYSYTSFDEEGNWTEARYRWNTDVDETHLTGNFIVQREFTYGE